MSGAFHFYTMRDKSSQHNDTFDVAQASICLATPVTAIDSKWASANLLHLLVHCIE